MAMMSNIDKKELIQMIRRNPLLIIGIGGLLGAILFTFTYGKQESQPANQIALPPSSPYEKNISGIGIVEANSKNISVGTFLQGIVAALFVTEGDIVKKGAPLFKLDTRSAEAEVQLREKEVATAKEQVAVAQAVLDEAQDQVTRVQNLKSGLAISEEEKKRRSFNFQKAQADMRRAQSDMNRAKAALNVVQIILDKTTVYAPTDGLILKVNTKVGEAVGDPNNSNAIILMGNHIPLHLRVQIDESDTWRFKPKARATAFLKSNKDIHFSLALVRVEPYAAPKQQLSGDMREQVDTRVVEVIYTIEGDTSLIAIGQQLDVFIETDKGV
mgnify:CR=1 FL=1